MLSEENYTDLKVKGYTVVPSVLTHEECDTTISGYQKWLCQFKDGEWPYSSNSLIQRYNTGHMEPTWLVRLKSKKVFAQVWGTDKLLSSFDAIAIGRPPEEGKEDFHRMGEHWLHLDQNPTRQGLHCYQGAVNLEEALEDDWTLEVMEGSHDQFESFYAGNARASMRATTNEFYPLQDTEVIKMRSRCKITRVPVPKGGIVLWDSRLVHANARPIKGRKNPGRWRYCVFVSMTPAIWASKEDIKYKKEAYEQAMMTTHWSSQGVRTSKSTIPSFAPRDVSYPKSVPDVARTQEAQQLAGVIPYGYNDGNPTGLELKPKWADGRYDSLYCKHKGLFIGVSCLLSSLAVCGIAYLIYRRTN